MAEPEVEAAWGAEFRRIRETEGSQSVPDDPKAAFRCSGDEAEARRPKRNTPIIIFSGPSLAPSLL